MVQFEYPRHWKPLVSFCFGVGRTPFSHYCPSGGNKNWPPSMKVKKLKILWNKMGSMGSKWSSLNTPGTENPLSHSILKLDESPFPIISPLGYKNWPPSMKLKKLKIFWNKIGSMGCKWSSLKAPGIETPFSHNQPSGILRIGLPV